MKLLTSPFKFLDSYQKDDLDIFFGREKETEKLYDALSGVKHLLVYGPSGAGKTSLIECGLRNQFSDADWFALTVRRGGDLNAAVFARIREQLREPFDLEPATKMPADPNFEFGDAVERLFAEQYKPVYLLFDQFEELLIQGSDAEKQAFFTHLQRLIRYKVPCRVLLVMREEFIGHLSEFEPLCPSIFQHRFRLEKMGRSNVQTVIQQILEAEKYQSDFLVEQPEALAKSILAKLPDTQREIELAHVQVFLEELWDRATVENKTQKPLLHSGLVQENDNLERVLDSFLKKQLEQLEQRHGEKVPMELLATMISERHTKLQMSAGDLENALAANAVELVYPVADLLRDLEQRRIIRTLKSGEETQFEISHDVLALVVGQNLTNEMKLREKAREVYRVYEGRAGMFSREDLDYLRGFEGFLAVPEELKVRIVESERVLQEKEKEELVKARKRLRTVAGLLGAAVLTGAMAIWLYFQSEGAKRQAVQEREKAEVAKSDAVANARQAEVSDSLAGVERDKALNQRNIAEKAFSDLKTEQRQKFKTAAEAARKEKRYTDALRAYQEVLRLAANPADAQTLRKQINETEREKNDYEFQRNKDIGLAMKEAGDCKGALVYLKKAAKNQNDLAVKTAITECINAKN